MDDGKIRAVYHNGRVSGAKHNDRNFDPAKADHIDPDRTCENISVHSYSQINPDMTFEQAEKRDYERYLGEWLKQRNAKQIENRHPDRVWTMDQLRENKRYCPEETIYQIGKMGQDIDPEVFKEICNEQLEWEQATFPNCKMLNVAVHMDESTPHMHKRSLWLSRGENGVLEPGMEKALARMGIERPDPNMGVSRYNNAKMTYTKMCREHFEGLCKEHGIELETEQRVDPGRCGLSKMEYIAREKQEEAERATKELGQAREELGQVQGATRARHNELAKLKEQEKDTKVRLEHYDDLAKKKSQKLRAMDKKIKDTDQEIRELVTSRTRAMEKPRGIDLFTPNKDKVTISRAQYDYLKAVGANNLQAMENVRQREEKADKRETEQDKRDAMQNERDLSLDEREADLNEFQHDLEVTVYSHEEKTRNNFINVVQEYGKKNNISMDGLISELKNPIKKIKNKVKKHIREEEKERDL